MSSFHSFGSESLRWSDFREKGNFLRMPIQNAEERTYIRLETDLDRMASSSLGYTTPTSHLSKESAGVCRGESDNKYSATLAVKTPDRVYIKKIGIRGESGTGSANWRSDAMG